LGIDIKTSSEACNHPAVREFVQKAVAKTNTQVVSNAAKIKEFRFIEGDFSTPGTELTPTLKLKRSVTEKKYIALVNDMYKEK